MILKNLENILDALRSINIKGEDNVEREVKTQKNAYRI
jgi:hypothetical protein